MTVRSWRSSLFLRLYVGFLCAALAGVVVAGVLVDRSVNAERLQLLAQHRSPRGRVVADSEGPLTEGDELVPEEIVLAQRSVRGVALRTNPQTGKTTVFVARAIVDGSLLDEVADGDAEFAAELVASFDRAVTKCLGELHAALAAGDAKAIARAAHTAKGASSQIGARELAKLCERMEELGRTREALPEPALVARAEAAFGRAKLLALAHLALARAA